MKWTIRRTGLLIQLNVLTLILHWLKSVFINSIISLNFSAFFQFFFNIIYGCVTFCEFYLIAFTYLWNLILLYCVFRSFHLVSIFSKWCCFLKQSFLIWILLLQLIVCFKMLPFKIKTFSPRLRLWKWEKTICVANFLLNLSSNELKKYKIKFKEGKILHA